MAESVGEFARAAVEMARGAGEILKGHFGRTSIQVAHKGPIDLVTAADTESEAFLLAEVRRRFPGHAIVAEESGDSAGEGAYRWLIDPLDGTVNFAHSLPQFAVLLALQERQEGEAFETVLAVTFDPMRDELFVAVRGQGATLNGVPMAVSRTDRLLDAIVATGFDYERLFRKQDNHAEFCRLNLITQGVRRFGSAGLDLAYVACGRYDFFWEYQLNPWDVAGGILLVEEAGGKVTNLAGEPAQVASGQVAASNARLHAPGLAAVSSAREFPIGSRQEIEVHLPPDMIERLERKG